MMMMTITQVVESEIIKLLDYDNEMDVFCQNKETFNCV